MPPWKEPGLFKVVSCGFVVDAVLCVLLLVHPFSVVEELPCTECDVVWDLWQNCTDSPLACSQQNVTDVHCPICLNVVGLTITLAVTMMLSFILCWVFFVSASGGWSRKCVCRAIVCGLASTCGLASHGLYQCAGKEMYPQHFVVLRVSWAFYLLLFAVCSSSLGSALHFYLHYPVPPSSPSPAGPRLPLPLPLLATGTMIERNVGQR